MSRSATKLTIFQKVDLTEGSISKGLLIFIIPLFLGQLLQQFYNLADSWVIGNFANNEAFAAVSSAGNLMFLITGFCNGLSIGGGVIISRYFGAKDMKNVSRAVHTNVLMGLVASLFATVVGLIFVPQILGLMNVPEEVWDYSVAYFRVYFAGVSTVIMYNIFMGIMRSLGDSTHPLLYLVISTGINVVLDLLFVAVFRWDVFGAGLATVIAQGISALLCMLRMMRATDESRLSFKELRYYPAIMKDVLLQGLPTGIQNSVISIGNIVIQANINSFGAFAMAGHGAYAKLEGFVFLPIMCFSMALPTFVSQNLGAGNPARAKKGTLFGVCTGVILAEVVGGFLMVFAEPLLRIFISEAGSVEFGLRHAAIQPWFYFVLAFSHTAAGALRGYGKSVIPMFAMLAVWCGFRILYVTVALHFIHVYDVIAWAYPITWSITTVIFSIALVREFAAFKNRQ